MCVQLGKAAPPPLTTVVPKTFLVEVRNFSATLKIVPSGNYTLDTRKRENGGERERERERERESVEGRNRLRGDDYQSKDMTKSEGVIFFCRVVVVIDWKSVINSLPCCDRQRMGQTPLSDETDFSFYIYFRCREEITNTFTVKLIMSNCNHQFELFLIISILFISSPLLLSNMSSILILILINTIKQ